MDMRASEDILDALKDLWGQGGLAPEGLWKLPAFARLRNACAVKYQDGKTTIGLPFALNHALRSLGLPCLCPSSIRTGEIEPQQAFNLIEAAFTQKTVRRRYLCPLDLADNIPSLSFGNAKVKRFTPAELDNLFDKPRMSRYYPDIRLDSDKFSQFYWLVVEEVVPLHQEVGDRAVPSFPVMMNADLGEIDPHKGKFPVAVEQALFFLLLAPWDEWSMMPEVDWRGFRIPWVYQLDEDLFVAPSVPRGADSLSWEPRFQVDDWGDLNEFEHPVELRLSDEATESLARLGDKEWMELQVAQGTELFETPVVHFLVRGFLSDGIDEFMAHLTTVEAAFGLPSDHQSHERARYPRLGATKRVARRLAAAVNEAGAAAIYEDLFNIRSAFIHGRGGSFRISTSLRLQARRIAARACAALVQLGKHPRVSREQTLNDLLDQGVHLVGTQPQR